VDAGSYLGDIDIGDMFHNFILHEKVQMLAGIDLTPFFPEKLTRKRELKAIWSRWVRSAMGWKSSPYNSIQGILVAEEVIKGDHLDEQNIFRWDYIDLHLPGDPVYQPGLPWICKRRKSDGCIAYDFVTYVDDMRSGGNVWIQARQVSGTIAMKLNYLGLQDAAVSIHTYSEGLQRSTQEPKRSPSGPEGTARTPQATDQRLAIRSHRPNTAWDPYSEGRTPPRDDSYPNALRVPCL